MSLTFANKITICRIFAVPFFIATILYYTPENDHLRFIALGIFMFAVISDFIDGYVARTRDQKTRAGAILDPLADKMLLISAFLCLYKMGPMFAKVSFPTWLVVGVISRDMILIVGAMIIQLVHGKLYIEPTFWGKATAFFQIISVIGVLIQYQYSFFFWYITIGLTAISLLGYILTGIKILNSGIKS